ncbi:hypothetical protein OHT76_42115 [Streptomyces sp. NBC_00287]|uniref:hypothetical protein n=1 Tax=Streptomyces sp. NBC_00287 TaxID=2975702 RepID=UPI002E28E7EE|nr:hypothetical protein [Streptomyces sp. NBC_00287]
MLNRILRATALLAVVGAVAAPVAVAVPAPSAPPETEAAACSSGGPTATVTGRLVRTSPGHPWLTVLDPPTRVGVSFFVPEKGEARIGLSGATEKGEPLLSRCMAPAADARVVDGGASCATATADQPSNRFLTAARTSVRLRGPLSAAMR